jgi:Uri superfamily endonuclease
MTTPATKVDPPEFPRAKGSYVLLLGLARPVDVVVGKLGRHHFAAGLYLYTGSARGPGGLAARLGHHLRTAGRCHWHIDYLRRQTPVLAVWVTRSTSDPASTTECRLAQGLARRWPLQQPFKGFGSSDCACFTHLLCWPSPNRPTTPFSSFATRSIERLDGWLRPLERIAPPSAT